LSPKIFWTHLKNMTPFNTLPERELTEIAGTMTQQKYPPGEMIIRQGVQGTHFYIVQSGLAKACLLDDEENETILGFLGESDCFGEISLMTQEPTTANIKAVEETVCLVQSKPRFMEMIEKHPAFVNFFNQLLSQRMRTVYRELLSENTGMGDVEPFLYRKQVQEMISPTLPFISGELSIQETTQKILDHKLEALIVIDDQKKPQGILGLNRIAGSVLLDRISPQEPIKKIMEKDFCTIDGKSYFFDALHQMMKEKTNVLVVLDGEKASGLLTGFDLLRFRGREVLSLLRNIETAPAIGQLQLMQKEVEKVLRALITDGAQALQACTIVSELNDKIVKRVIELTAKECGTPPCPYAWLGLGSEGRKEQTLFTDQDNGIIFSDDCAPEDRPYFQKFSQKVVDSLHRCGVPLCKGEVMATNPKFFGTLKEWKSRAGKWITAPSLDEKEVMDTYVFLDYRTIHGDYRLGKELKKAVQDMIRVYPSFLRVIAENVVSISVPIGFFKNFIIEKSGEHKNRLSLKLYGLLPLVTCAKILALQVGSGETNTKERLRALARAGQISSDKEDMLEQALETFLSLKIKNDIKGIDEGKEYGAYINPEDLSIRQKQLLKEAFWAVSEFQKITKNRLRMEESSFGM
jgi:CBS domain-containing protein